MESVIFDGANMDVCARHIGLVARQEHMCQCPVEEDHHGSSRLSAVETRDVLVVISSTFDGQDRVEEGIWNSGEVDGR